MENKRLTWDEEIAEKLIGKTVSRVTIDPTKSGATEIELTFTDGDKLWVYPADIGDYSSDDDDEIEAEIRIILINKAKETL